MIAERTWRKSSYTGSTGNCVEVVAGPATVGIRDSKNIGPRLWVTADAFAQFLAAAKRETRTEA